MMQNTTKTQSSSETRGFWISQGIIVALSPVIGYGLAFLYELGFCLVFEIPREFITLNLTAVFIAAGSLVVIIFIFYWLIDIFLRLVPQRDSLLFRELGLFLAISLLPVGLLILWWGLWERLIVVAGVFFFFVFLEFIMPLFTQRSKGSYLQKLEAQRKYEIAGPKGVVEHLADFLGRRAFLTFLAIIILLFLAGLAGESKAVKQDKFFVPSTYPDSVVLRIYGENIICAPLDAKEKEIQKNFFVIRMTDEPRPMLQLQKIGPLRVKGE